MTTYKLISKLSTMIVLLYLDIITTNNDIITLGGIILDLLCLL